MVYRHAYATVSKARAALDRYLTLYHTRRRHLSRHLSLANHTPDAAYFLTMRSPLRVAA